MSLYQCPHCGEKVDTEPDRGGGEELEYIEDCPVRCRPNLLRARYEADSDDFVIHAEREI